MGKKQSLEKILTARLRRDERTGCMIFTGCTDPRGYGMTGRGRAHRVAWEMKHGLIPTGLFVLHNCPGGDNPACCNPEHLWLGTQLDNIADRQKKNRQAKGSKIHQARLREEQIGAIRLDARSHRAIARDYGVDHSQITRIKNRQQWGHAS